MKVVENGHNKFVILCDVEELVVLDNGLSWFISECDMPDPDINFAKQMMKDIANCESML